jgi:hypothetical protein
MRQADAGSIKRSDLPWWFRAAIKVLGPRRKRALHPLMAVLFSRLLELSKRQTRQTHTHP